MIKIILPIIGLMLCVSKVSAQTAGNTLQFDGIDDHVVCGLPSVFNNIETNDLTFEMWVNIETSQFCRLIYAQLDVDNFAVISLNSTNEVVFYLQENGVNHSVQSVDVVPVSSWVHIAATWNATSSEAKIYIDGSEVSYTGGLFVSSTGLDNMMTVGSRTDGNQVFSGQIDELSIWGSVRTECEISIDRNDKRMGNEAGLVAQYNFDEGVAGGSNPGVDDLPDVTGNFNDGSLVGFDLSGAISNWTVSGIQINGFISDPTTADLTGEVLSTGIIADQYQWIDCNTNVPIVGATNSDFNPTVDDPNYIATIGGLYAVVLSQGNCFDTSDCVVYDFASMNDLSTQKLEIYPNPSNGHFFVELPNGAEEVQVISFTGEVIEKFSLNGLDKIEFNLTELSGVYLLQVITETSVITEKISLEKI